MIQPSDMTTSFPAEQLRIVFAGTPPFAATHLKALLNCGLNIVSVYTQPDRPAGRGKKLSASAVKQLALAEKLSIYQPANFKTSDAVDQLANLRPDLLVVVAYGLLLPRPVLDIPRLGCINVHASLLPRWRGAAPIQRAIAAGDKYSGVTIMQMDEGLDTGAMLWREECPIHETDTAAELQDRIAILGANCLLTVIRQLAAGVAEATPQDASLSTYAAKISKEEALIDWRRDALTLSRQIRAFNPFPVSYSFIDGKRVKIWLAMPTDNHTAVEPGTILQATATGITVACGTGALRITELQLPDKTRLPVEEILKSRAALFTPGQQFYSPADG